MHHRGTQEPSRALDEQQADRLGGVDGLLVLGGVPLQPHLHRIRTETAIPKR